jgi:hypothetical protein
MGVRLYNPNTGRFLQTDPIPGGSANPYDYANQDPINNTDIAGTICWHCCAHKANSLLRNPIVRGVVIGFAISAVCAGSAGIGCGLAVGAAVGGGLGVLNHVVNRTRRSWQASFALGALQGATNGASGGIFRQLSQGTANSAFRFFMRSVPGTVLVNGFLGRFRGWGY